MVVFEHSYGALIIILNKILINIFFIFGIKVKENI